MKKQIRNFLQGWVIVLAYCSAPLLLLIIGGIALGFILDVHFLIGAALAFGGYLLFGLITQILFRVIKFFLSKK